MTIFMRMLLIGTLFVSTHVYSQQSAFYDAIFIYDSCFDKDEEQFIRKETLFDVLRKYYGDSLSEAVLRRNPFFEPYVPMSMALSTERSSFFDKAIGSLGGINVTNFADGLAKFMVKRFKEELNLAFFQKFKEDLEDDRYRDLRILFPETHSSLQVIGIEIYRYNVYIMTLREAFIKDLTNLYSNLDDLFKLPKYKTYLDARPLLSSILKTSLYLVDRLSRGVHAGDILAQFPVRDLNFGDPAITNNVAGSLETMKLFSASLRSISPERYWVDEDSVGILFKDNKLIRFKIYLGLIFQQSKELPITFNNGKRLDSILALLPPHLDSLNKYKTFIESFAAQAQEVNEYIIELKAKKKSDIDYNDYYELFDASLDIMEHAFQFVELPFVDNFVSSTSRAGILEKSGHWLFVARRSGEIYVDTRTTNYSSAILNVTAILDTLVKDSAHRVKGKILKYGTFMSTIAASENSDDVATAIEAVALPVGGSGIKKHSTFNIAIQTYLGGSYGSETIKELKTNQTKNVASVFGPVGVSFSWNVMRRWKHPASVSIVGNILDLGAIASFRFKDDSTSIDSKIELRNIFAPGVYFVVGIPRFPLSIGYGFQTGPQLREIKSGVPTFETKKIYTRSSFFLAVDIPLFNIYNKAE